jgi:hypothetical protein
LPTSTLPPSELRFFWWDGIGHDEDNFTRVVAGVENWQQPYRQKRMVANTDPTTYYETSFFVGGVVLGTMKMNLREWLPTAG